MSKYPDDMSDAEIIDRIAYWNDWTLHDNYIGRGMYGQGCMAIEGEDATEIIEAVAAEDITGARTDQLGLNMIVYWPGITKENT